MAEIHPGVYVSSIDTDAWEPDEEVGGDVHILCTDVGIDAGMSRFMTQPAEPVSYTPPARETVVVLEGRARVEIAGGPTVELSPGVLASLPGGVECTWHVEPGFKEVWVLGG
jgi:uncharacterized cupin superfamily protein